MLLGTALIAAAPAQGGSKNSLASIDARAVLSDGGAGRASMKLRVDQFASGAGPVLKGKLDFRYEDPTGNQRVSASFKPKEEEGTLTGTLSVTGANALYVGPAELSTAAGKKPAIAIMMITDRHTGKAPAAGAGDMVWMIVVPEEGSAAFIYSGLVTSGDIVLNGS
jgi:hypothetical protein